MVVLDGVLEEQAGEEDQNRIEGQAFTLVGTR